jgi:hypothetical protein
LTIQINVYAYLGILLEGRERFEEESLGNLKKSQYLLHTAGLILMFPPFPAPLKLKYDNFY